jgi:dTDP-4-dehydrorhamnose reductase
MKKVLLLGASGQLGREVASRAPETVVLQALTKTELDITSEPDVDRVITSSHPDIVINAAAYTQVDKAESESEQAFAVNEKGIEHVSNSCPSETRILHLSTDFVFNTLQASPYLPDDPPEPVSAYGRSKLAGEQALLKNRPKTSVVLRTSWLYGTETKNFLTTMLELIKTRDELNVVNDQFSSPTSVETLADIVWKLALDGDAHGIFHWSDRGVITWYDFALEIQQQALELNLLTTRIPVNPISTKEYPTPATRPEYSALDSTTTEAITGMKTRPWKEQLASVLEKIKHQESPNA